MHRLFLNASLAIVAGAAVAAAVANAMPLFLKQRPPHCKSVQLVPDSGEIERSYQCFCKWRARDREPADLAHRPIIALAAEHKLPAVYYRRYYVERGGLVSYGYDVIQQYRSTAGYVDRSLKGEKPADLPVQAPTKQLVINLKTAKAFGLTIPPSVLARADEVIEESSHQRPAAEAHSRSRSTQP